MAEAILIRVTTEIMIGGERATALWIVATADPEAAVQAVQDRPSSAYVIEVTDTPVPTGLIARLRLAPGQAWQM